MPLRRIRAGAALAAAVAAINTQVFYASLAKVIMAFLITAVAAFLDINIIALRAALLITACTNTLAISFLAAMIPARISSRTMWQSAFALVIVVVFSGLGLLIKGRITVYSFLYAY